MKTTMNMVLARRMGLALVLGLPILLTGGCPQGSELLDEGLGLIRDLREGATSGNPTESANPVDGSGGSNQPGDTSGGTQDQPAQDQGTDRATPIPPQDPGVPHLDPPPAETDPQPGGESNPYEQEAQRIQQALGGMRLTYRSSESNGDMYTSHREEHDLCSSGGFQTRIVDQTSGYGVANEDIYESTGTWRITVVGTQLVLEVNTQQSSTGYSGIDQYSIAYPPGELYISGVRYYVTPDNPICD